VNDAGVLFSRFDGNLGRHYVGTDRSTATTVIQLSDVQDEAHLRPNPSLLIVVYS